MRQFSIDVEESCFRKFDHPCGLGLNRRRILETLQQNRYLEPHREAAAPPHCSAIRQRVCDDRDMVLGLCTE
jgi:hypothetical protein